MMMNKKGGAMDIFFIMMIIFVFALMSIIALTFYDKYTEGIEGNAAFNTTWNDDIETQSRATLLSFDAILPFLMLGLLIVVIVSSFYIRTHPLFFFISLFILILAIVVAAIFSNVFTNIVEGQSDFQSSSANFTIITYIMDHLPSFIMLIGGLLLVILYAKSRFDEP